MLALVVATISLSKAVAEAKTEMENVLCHAEILKEQYRTAMEEARNEEQRARQRKRTCASAWKIPVANESCRTKW